MAALDIEKRALLTLEEDNGTQPSLERPQRRRTLPWLALFLGVSVILSIGATFHRCSAETSLFTSHVASQVNRAHAELRSHAISSRSSTVKLDETASVTTSAAAPTRTVLKTFEVAQPVLMPDGPAESDGSTRHGKDYSPELCTVLLMRHDFAWSYDAPFVGELGYSQPYTMRVPSLLSRL
jgi:hypothetical protein